MRLLLLVLTVICLWNRCCGGESNRGHVTAICKMVKNCGADSCVTGVFLLNQKTSGGDTTITGFLQNVQPNGLHGWHVHESGILKPAEGCASTGGHFNPDGVTHGAPDAKVRHVGDLGNFKAKGPLGLVSIRQTDKLVSLVGDPSRSVVGRSIVIHAGEDDLGLGKGSAREGSLASGNSGARIGCCVIEKIF